MQVIKTSSGKTIKISRNEWEAIGKKAGWMRKADYERWDANISPKEDVERALVNRLKEATKPDSEELLSNEQLVLEEKINQLASWIMNNAYVSLPEETENPFSPDTSM